MPKVTTPAEQVNSQNQQSKQPNPSKPYSRNGFFCASFGNGDIQGECCLNGISAWGAYFAVSSGFLFYLELWVGF
jgi:hypothetical protein